MATAKLKRSVLYTMAETPKSFPRVCAILAKDETTEAQRNNARSITGEHDVNRVPDDGIFYDWAKSDIRRIRDKFDVIIEFYQRSESLFITVREVISSDMKRGVIMASGSNWNALKRIVLKHIKDKSFMNRCNFDSSMDSAIVARILDERGASIFSAEELAELINKYRRN